MKYKPHNYQTRATSFILDHQQAAIVLGMGLGKTIITLTALHNLILNRFQVRKALIIAPIRVARDTWPAELGKWDHLRDLTMAVMVGTPTQRKKALHSQADIYTINRENIPWLIKELDGKWPFDMVIIDELSSFKNPSSKRFKQLRKVRKHITRIVGLTGTPAPNSLMDLWAQYALLDGGTRLEPTITAYRSKYFRPGRRKGYVVYEWILMPGSEQQIYDQIQDITLSMKTTDYLQLPPLTTVTVPVSMSAKERKIYHLLQQNMIATLNDGTEIDTANAATLSGQLQQLASGAIYVGDEHNWKEIHRAKINALIDIVEQAEEQPVLVCYWFKHEEERIMQALPQARHLDTTEDFQDWNNGTIPVALIHPASAGHGLNLQAGGHILVWFTTPWSLELYGQANARLHRQGQTQPVTIIHIDTEGTIDARVHKALAKKDVTQSALIDAVKAELGAAK